jgi:hypothetical protein
MATDGLPRLIKLLPHPDERDPADPRHLPSDRSISKAALYSK